MNRRITFAGCTIAVVTSALFTGCTIAVVTSALLAGCSDPTPVSNEKLKAEQSGRFNVTSAQVINDAEGHSRDILVLRDVDTGREYIAVMGAGVVEMRMQSNGKTMYQVEE
jgi:hypothetical protein